MYASFQLLTRQDGSNRAWQSTSGLYNFSNIRYAAPPLGDLRFRAPVLPAQNRTHVQTGDVGRICPQATPLWINIEPGFLLSLQYNTTFTQSTNISSYPYVPAKIDPRTSEDCLFLDVVVPKAIFDRGQQNSNHGQHKSGFVPKHKLAPVLVWIYGGGYVGGDKSSTDPTGLIERSQVVGEGIVYVAFNYRVRYKDVNRERGSQLTFYLFVARRIWLAWW